MSEEKEDTVMNKVVTHVETHPSTAALYAEVARYKLKWLGLIFLPAIPPFAIVILLITKVIRLPGSQLLNGLLVLAYGFCWALLILLGLKYRAYARSMEDGLKKITSQDIHENRWQHEAALKILSDYKKGLPFVLFLRNFDIESYDRLSPKPRKRGELEALLSVSKPPGATEEKLAGALANRAAILGLANPSNVIPSRSIVPKLQLPKENWRTSLLDLVDAATIIVVDLEELSDSIRFELNTILEHQAQDRTVIILPSNNPKVAENDIALEQAVGQLYRVSTPAFESAEVLRRVLSSFPRVACQDEVPWDNLDASPLFADLLRKIDFARSLNPEQRKELDQALALKDEGLAHMRQGRYPEALAALQQSSSIQLKVGNKSFFFVPTLLDLGAVYQKMEDYSSALYYYQQALAIAREIKDEEAMGVLLESIGDVYLLRGEREQALSHYLEAAELSIKAAPRSK